MNMIRCAIRNIQRWTPVNHSKCCLWGLVADIFGLGSTSSIELCERLGFDAHAKLPESEVDKLARLIAAEINEEMQENDPWQKAEKLEGKLGKIWEYCSQSLTI